MLDDGSATADALPEADIDPRYTCVACGERFIPRNKRHVRTCGSKRCQWRAEHIRSRLSLHNVIADHERCARWRESNGAYHNARISLRKRGLLTSETQSRLVTLKGRGMLDTHEALRECGLGALVSSRVETPTLGPVATIAKTRRTRIAPSEPNADAWTLPSPQTHEFIARAAQLVFARDGIPRQRIRDYVGARMLHGVLHHALEVGHSKDRTPFALVLPSAKSGALWFVENTPGLIERLPKSVLVGDDTERLDLSTRVVSRLRAPPARDPGQYRARVIAAGPLVLKKSARVIAKRDRSLPYLHQLQTNPTSLAGTLSCVARRIGLEIDPALIVARVTSHDLDEIEGGLRVGGHWQMGPRRGWVDCLVGTIDLECNAVGRWLLDVAALLGLGSKTSIGLGRVRVEDL